MRSPYLFAWLSVLAVLMGVTGYARADILEYSTEVPGGGGTYAAGTSGNFSLPQFDPAYGTLISVILQVTGNSFGGHNGIHNTSYIHSGFATLSIGSTITVTGPESLTVVTLPTETVSNTISTYTGPPPTFAPPDGLTVYGSSSQDIETSSPAGLTSYIGTGNITYNFTSWANYSISLIGSLQFPELNYNTAAPDFNFVGEVTYNYDPAPAAVPEPGTLTLLVIATGATAALCRRKRKE